ncbi:MAG: hypothetical protein Q8M94_02035 [Ignavibacteria bacterium]|nr:hypothetical protein [Ignavibacteria bacterium]
MRKAIIYTSIIWTAVFLICFGLRVCNIFSKYLFFENLTTLIQLNIWFVPFLLIFLIRKKINRIIALSTSAVLLIILSPFIFILNIWGIDNLLIGNGYRKIYEKEISNQQYFSIYRSPDEGALGGDLKVYAIDNKLPLGFVKRDLLSIGDFDLSHNYRINIDTVIFNNDTIIVHCDKLIGKGDLR